jgi:small subunit ribosomal protein S17
VGERQDSARKQLIGDVVSDKMDKTVVVRVERLTRHPRYGKVLRRTKKYKAHDEENTCRVGDRVCIVESRPLSREKRWVVVEIVERAGGETGAGVSR